MRAQGRGRSIFDDFFDNYPTVRKRVVTPTITFHVTPLHAGAPSSFAGGVIMLAQSLVMITQAIKTAGDISNLETTAFTMLASLGVVELILLSFIKATDKNKYDSSLTDRINVMIKAFIAISASLLIISAALKLLNGIDEIFSIGVVMIGIVGVIGIVIAAFAELTKKQVASMLAERIGAIGSAFMAIAAAVLMISIAMGIIR